jgi:tetratricopeptide (TPR) repeat protein
LVSYPLSNTMTAFYVTLSLSRIAMHSKVIYTLKQTHIRFAGAFFLALLIIIIVNLHKKNKIIKIWSEMVNENEISKSSLIKYQLIMSSSVSTDGEFLYNYGAWLAKAGLYNESISILNHAKKKFSHNELDLILAENYRSLKKYGSAEMAYIGTISMVPNRLFPRYRLASMYMQLYDTVKFIKTSEELVQINPKVKSFLTDEIIKQTKINLKSHRRQ